MDIGTEVVLTATVAVFGNYAKNDSWPSIKNVVGGGVYFLFLTAIASSQQKLAEQIGLLVLVSTLLIYITYIAKKLGYTGTYEHKVKKG